MIVFGTKPKQVLYKVANNIIYNSNKQSLNISLFPFFLYNISNVHIMDSILPQ